MNLSVFTMFEIPTADPWTKQMPLLSSAWTVTFILIAYTVFVLKLGRIFMEKRNPYNLKKVLLVYNIFQMLYNGIFFMLSFYCIIINSPYDRLCMQSLPLDHPHKDIERWLTYLYYFNKYVDLVDTIFFVLRKSYKQITMLHVYHHLMMVYTIFWVLRLYGVGGQYTLMGLCNSFVHTVMYFYYLIAAMYPGLKSSLWWKKYITIIQLLQFAILFFQAIIVMVFNPSCTFPTFMQYQQIFQATVMLILFSKFYYKTYIQPKQKKQQ